MDLKSKSLREIEGIKDEYSLDDVEAYIDYLETKIDNIEGEKESLRDEINGLQDEIENYESAISFGYPAGYNRSIVSDLVLEELFKNLDFIPLSSIDSLIKEHIS